MSKTARPWAWAMTVAALAGESVPPPPALPGVAHQCRDPDGDPHAERWDERTKAALIDSEDTID